MAETPDLEMKAKPLTIAAFIQFIHSFIHQTLRNNHKSGQKLKSKDFFTLFVIHSLWYRPLPERAPFGVFRRLDGEHPLEIWLHFPACTFVFWAIIWQDGHNGFLYLEQPHPNFVMFLSEALSWILQQLRYNILTKQKRLCTISYFALLAKSGVLLSLSGTVLFECSPYQRLASHKFEPKLSKHKGSPKTTLVSSWLLLYQENQWPTLTKMEIIKRKQRKKILPPFLRSVIILVGLERKWHQKSSALWWWHQMSSYVVS